MRFLLYALIFIYINVFTAKRYYLCVCKEQILTAMNRVFILTCIFSAVVFDFLEGRLATAYHELYEAYL